jgi:hypothetical protein
LGNQSPEELRRIYRTTTPSERIMRGLKLSRLGGRLRAQVSARRSERPQDRIDLADLEAAREEDER